MDKPQSQSMRFNKLAICLTDRCNAQCQMCCFSCKPVSYTHLWKASL